MGSFECQFCSKKFSTRTNLNRHLKNIKCCPDHTTTEITEFECPDCAKVFKSKSGFQYHVKNKVCEKRHPVVEVEDLKEQVEDLKAQNKFLIEKLADKVTTVNNNNNTYNLLVLDPKDFEKCAQLMDNTHLQIDKNGSAKSFASGFAQLLSDSELLKDKVILSDPSRLIFRFLLPGTDGKMPTEVSDKDGHKLSGYFFEGIKDKAEEIINDRIKRYENQLTNDPIDDFEIKKLINKLRDLLRKINDIAARKLKTIDVRDKFVRILPKIVQGKNSVLVDLTEVADDPHGRQDENAETDDESEYEYENSDDDEE